MRPLPTPPRDRRQTLVATMQLLRTADAARLFAQAGFDALVVDAEHAGFSPAEVSDLCLAAIDAGIFPLVRLPDAAPGPIRQALSFGALGVVVPRVETAAEARAIVDNTRFPPHGARPVPPVFPQAGRARVTQADAVAALTAATTVVVIIETAAGVAAAAEIAAVPGVDVLFLGFSDLSFGLGTTKEDPQLWQAAERVRDAALSAGKVAGIGGITDPLHFDRALEMGFGYLSAANDATLLAEAAAGRAAWLRARAADGPAR